MPIVISVVTILEVNPFLAQPNSNVDKTQNLKIKEIIENSPSIPRMICFILSRNLVICKICSTGLHQTLLAPMPAFLRPKLHNYSDQ